MKIQLFTFLAVVSVSCAASPQTTTSILAEDDGSCGSDRAALMSMDYWEFDQSPNGIQSVLRKPGCRTEGADLIRDYHAALREAGRPVTHDFPESKITFSDDGEVPLLYWHEGQVRAMEGDTPTAVELFRLSLKPPEENNAGWNEYVRANIAFLEGDFERLLNEREALSAMARPGYGDINLGVVNGLIACFGRTYLDAYTTAECDRRPMQ